MQIPSTYLNELQVVEHLVVDLLDEIPGKINGANFGDAAERAPPDVCYQIVRKIQTPQEPHAFERIRIEPFYFIVRHIQDPQHRIPGESSPATR